MAMVKRGTSFKAANIVEEVYTPIEEGTVFEVKDDQEVKDEHAEEV